MTSSGLGSGTGSIKTSGVETVVDSIHGKVVVVHGTVVVHGAVVVVGHGVVVVVHGSSVDFGATHGRNRCNSQSLMVFNSHG